MDKVMEEYQVARKFRDRTKKTKKQANQWGRDATEV